MHAVELARLGAGAAGPGGHGVVFAEVAPVGIEVRVFVADEVEVIEVAVAGAEGSRQGHGFGVADAAQVVLLGMGEGTAAPDELHVLGRVVLGRGQADADVFLARAVAGFAVDAGLGPGGRVGVGLGIVIGGKLADVAAIAAGIEGVGPFLPMEGLAWAAGEMAHGAAGHVVPLLAAHVVGQRHGLQPAFFQGGQEIEDVFAAQDLGDGIGFGLPVDAFFHEALAGAQAHAVGGLADDDVRVLGAKQRCGHGVVVGPHGQSVEGGGPELVEFFVAVAATGRAGEGLCGNRGGGGLWGGGCGNIRGGCGDAKAKGQSETTRQIRHGKHPVSGYVVLLRCREGAAVFAHAYHVHGPTWNRPWPGFLHRGSDGGCHAAAPPTAAPPSAR